MPKIKQPCDLKNICINSICFHIDTYWNKVTDVVTNFERNRGLCYTIGPFECLNDENVHKLMKILKDQKRLTKYNLYLLLHYWLKRLDLSELRKIHQINDPRLVNHISNNCINLVELNLSCKEDLTASSMCKILKHLNNLKKLNLGHTLANVSVIETLIKATTQIEDLNFDNCKAMDFEQFAQLIVNAYENRLKYLSIDNVLIEDKYVLLILLNCNKLKYFQENRLLENMTFVYKNPDKFGFKPVFIIEKIDFIQNQTCLNEDMMRAMCEQVPYLKTLSLNCICQGTSVLKYLNMFENLQSLTLINTNMMSFKMENYLCNFLCLNGRVLNHLELINIPDINLFLIIRFCSNLVTLIIETCRYYYPLNVNCNDPYEDELDFDSYLAKCKLMKTLKNLKTLVIKNSCYDGSISFINVDKYVKHILLLIQKSGQSLENLKFECLRFIDNEFLFECFEYLTNLKCLELNQLHNISFIFVKSLVTSRTSNVLQELKLIDCKLLTKQDQIKLNREIKRKNFNLELSYK